MRGSPHPLSRNAILLTHKALRAKWAPVFKKALLTPQKHHRDMCRPSMKTPAHPPKKTAPSPRVKTHRLSGGLRASHLQHETRRDWRHRAIFVHLIQAAVYYTVITARTLTAPGTRNSLQVPHIAVRKIGREDGKRGFYYFRAVEASKWGETRLSEQVRASVPYSRSYIGRDTPR